MAIAPWQKIDGYLLRRKVKIGPPTLGQTTGGKHAPGSYHYADGGQARDHGVSNSNCHRIVEVMKPFALGPRHILPELYFGNTFIKNGRAIVPSGSLHRSHQNHSHTAIKLGVDFPEVPADPVDPPHPPPLPAKPLFLGENMEDYSVLQLHRRNVDYSGYPEYTGHGGALLGGPTYDYEYAYADMRRMGPTGWFSYLLLRPKNFSKPDGRSLTQVVADIYFPNALARHVLLQGTSLVTVTAEGPGAVVVTGVPRTGTIREGEWWPGRRGLIADPDPATKPEIVVYRVHDKWVV